MSDDKNVEWAYTIANHHTADDFDNLSLDKLADAMLREMREKMDNDLMGSLLRPREWEQLRSPQPNIKIDYPSSFADSGLFPSVPIVRSQYIPRGEAVAVRGFGVVIGEGPATSQLAAVSPQPEHCLPVWVIQVLMALALLVLTAVIGM